MSLSAVLRLLMWAVFLCAVSEVLAADPPEDNAWRERATAAEIELVDTVNALYEAYGKLHEAVDKIADPVKEREYWKAHDPGREFIPKLIEIERKNQGTQVGLIVCRRLLVLGGAEPGSPYRAGLQHVLKQLPHYVDDPLSVWFIRYLSTQSPDPAIPKALKTQTENEQAHPVVRDACRLYLAEYFFSKAAGREFRERRLKELNAGDKPRYHSERETLSESLERYPDWDTIRKHEAEAVSLLEQLVAKDADHRLPAVTNIDPDWILLRLKDGPNSNPRLAEMADGLLFKHQHLKIGKAAPDLQLKLLGGRGWSLHAQRGRVVIIQFSFKGCGPCEAMYPDLRELSAAHPEDLAVLSIMSDKEEKDAIEAKESGKVTWNASWDGDRGPTNTRWGVRGYPTVYVIDKQGRVAGYGLRGEELKQKIAELISASLPNSDP